MNPSQTNLWNLFASPNASGGASTKAAASGMTTMNWTRTAPAGYMALVAVPINPVPGPAISISGTLGAFGTIHGTPSTAQTYNVSGSNLTANISIHAPTGFEIATASGGPYSSDLTLIQSGGTVGSTPIYARLTGANEGTFSGNITHTSTDATEKDVAVNGTVNHPPIEKSVDKANASPGETLSYTINSIHYDGSELLTNVNVNDSIPVGTTYVADSDSPQASVTPADDSSATLLTWNIGSNTAGTPGSLGGGGGGAVTLDGTAGSTPVQDSTPTTGLITNSTSATFGHTTGSGANRLLLVAVSFYHSTTARTVSSVTFNGTSNHLHLVGTIYNGTTRRVEIWEMTAPPASTTGNVVVTLSGAASYAVAGAVSFRGVDQCNPIGTFLGATGTGTTASVSPTTVAGDLVFDTVAGGSALTIDPSQASQWNTSTTNIFGAASTKTATTSSTSMSWTLTSGAWASGAVTIKPVNNSVSCAATVTSASSITDTHTTGTGNNRLMLVGVVWNAGSSSAKIPTTGVTFTYGETTLTLTKQIEREHGSSGSYRYASIYSYLNPPSGQPGTVTVNFSVNVTNGIVVGVANLAGVDQTTPIPATNANSGAAATTFNVSVPTADSNELVFDTAYRGGTAPTPYEIADQSQTSLWNAVPPYSSSANTRGGASIKQATTTSTTMGWTQSGTSGTWVIVGAAINPASGDPLRTTTLSTTGTLVSTDGSFTLTARLTNANPDTNVTPGALTPTYTGGASGVTCSGPTPANGSISAGGYLDFSWACTPTATDIGSVAFTLNGATGTSYSYPSGTSNSVLVVPALTFQATVKDPPGVGRIDNTASLQDTGAIIGTKSSNTATTVVRPQLTVNAGTGGTITAPATSPATYDYGEAATITASPNAGYHFVNWTGDVSTVANVDAASTTVTMNSNYTIAANFAINTYTLDYAAGAHGSLTGDTSQTVAYGGDGTAVTAVPDVGYHFVNWSDGSTANPRTDTNVTVNVDVAANFADTTPPELTITGATADGTAMSGNLTDGYALATTNVATLDHLIQFAANTAASEPLQAAYFGLKLTASTVSAADLKAYYEARGVPEPYLGYLKGAADGANPFVYIQGNGTTAVALVDAAKHDIQSVDVDMTVPDDFPLGTYTVQGVIKDLAGNETTVTLKLIVAGDRVAPTLTITGATADGTAMSGNLTDGYVLATTNVATLDHLIQFAAGTVASEALAAQYFGLKLIASTVSTADLKAYYDGRGVPDPFLTYLKAAADGLNPFVYIKGSTVTLVDAAKHDILSTDVAMTVPDDFPLGTYTVQGVIRDVAGNATPVTLKLIVSGNRPPVVSITLSQLSWQPLLGATYNVYQSTTKPYCEPGDAEHVYPVLVSSYPLPADTSHNYYYFVRAVNGPVQSDNSNRVGRFTFTLVPGQ